MILGVHVSGMAKLHESFEHSKALGCNTIQIFSRSPQRWRQKALDAQEAEAFIDSRKKCHINPVFIHAPYLINLASPERKLYGASIKAYIEDIKEAALLKADYIVTHMGSHKKTSENAGLKRLTAALNTILDKTADTNVRILLENTSGSGSWLGYKFLHQKKVLEGIKDKFRQRVGLCLDTAHAYSAGYDIADSEGLEALIQEIDSLVGVNRIKLIHLNDTKDKLNSRHDRHYHIGQGNIGMGGMSLIINHPKLRNIAYILETPKDSGQADQMNLNTVRKLRH